MYASTPVPFFDTRVKGRPSAHWSGTPLFALTVPLSIQALLGPISTPGVPDVMTLGNRALGVPGVKIFFINVITLFSTNCIYQYIPIYRMQIKSFRLFLFCYGIKNY